ncbi:MAG: hypothetical protein JNN00_06615 [Chitinophagaceae bacterium]|nr:hypothetical protein [Chitinophagaceae bacterium]
MINIRCSLLEAIRVNPTAYGQLLATSDYNNGGGSHGMLAYLHDIARLVHLGELLPTEGVKELYNKFHRFSNTPLNKKRQEKLVSQFLNYCKRFDENEFVFVGGSKLIKWEFSREARLTGRTPWVVANENAYFSYILVENDYDWKDELRFPIFQQYLADKIIECGTDEIKVGIYSLSRDQFEFKTYSEIELKEAILETGQIFSKVLKEYNKLKKSK